MNVPPTSPIAVVTGASSGIGEATARQLAAAGFHVVVGARRLDRLERIAAEIGGTALELDVTDPESVAAFSAAVPRVEVLVNNAGGALGVEPVAESELETWRWMYEVNVLGTLSVTKTLLPALIASGNGRVVNIGSIAAREPYRGGAGYNAAKHAVSALTRVLRIEMMGEPVRVTQIDPGMAETEFSVIRFSGDAARAASVYDGMVPLTAEDVAEAIVFAVTRPPHVNIDTMLIMPTDQVAAQVIHRR
ncbi:SDR family NAD(P)-dependent oxidoreductase [Homoserinibacter sp. YIM 151385]|uniref:SDR family NAD(P)-dependent oxidoreductase n=1 Tax=Homoserinibacter sp. YIM 151385 TaxID=2985506 RepID=UPI0022F0C502|nr:SDR family NAD(P)-dependent oxidoreductase [Homoserinibacter sp. YIM 151385]WBU36727.1 SDR family NAD(P)-dependent oxidoreductase [Homoserinibacter sp. YIM 151385]